MQIPPDASKYTRPHLPPIVSRDRLIARLREKESANRVLLIGQAAQGKTTLAAAYAETIGGPAAWLHLEAGDGDRRRFFSLLVQALAQTCPDTPLDRFGDQGAMAMGGTDSEARYQAVDQLRLRAKCGVAALGKSLTTHGGCCVFPIGLRLAFRPDSC